MTREHKHILRRRRNIFGMHTFVFLKSPFPSYCQLHSPMSGPLGESEDSCDRAIWDDYSTAMTTNVPNSG